MDYKRHDRVNYNKADRSYNVDNVFIAFDYLNPVMEMKVFTLCDMHDLDNISILEQILDNSSIVSASKIQERIPPRTKADKFKGALAEIAKNSRYSEITISSTSDGKYPFETTLYLLEKRRLGPEDGHDVGYSRLFISMHKKETTKSDNDIIEFKKLFFDLCSGLKAFTGFCTEHSFLTQSSLYYALAVDNVRNRKKQPNFDYELGDVLWLNYFGPGYVEFWGKDKIKALERSYYVTRDVNNGIGVQTAEEPTFADINVDRISDYIFKQPMYEILGHNTFMHETSQPGERGENVPTLENMRNLI